MRAEISRTPYAYQRPYFLNVSEKHKSFIWSQPKTGSTSFINVFKNLDFYRWDFDKDGLLVEKTDHILHNHNCKLFQGHENFTFIASARNPYASAYSMFRLHTVNKFDGIEILERHFLPNFNSLAGCCHCFNERIPDYFIRLENLFDDYSKITFIVQSDLYKSGKLFDLCKVKLNSSGTPENKWKEFYDKDTADLVYYSNANYFEILGYHKDSWME